jgi:hypothetical protein
VYWLFLTNQRLASFIPEATVTDLLRVPLPKITGPDRLRQSARADTDALLKPALGLDEFDWTLVTDFFTYTLPDFKQLANAPGPKATKRGPGEDELLRYCDFFLHVLEAAFDGSHRFSATIFRESGSERLAVRLIAIHLKSEWSERVREEPIGSSALLERLRDLERLLWATRADQGIAFQRVARVYSEYRVGKKAIPTLFLVKPDQAKYWTASAGMRDADEAFNEIMLWDGRRAKTEPRSEA